MSKGKKKKKKANPTCRSSDVSIVRHVVSPKISDSGTGFLSALLTLKGKGIHTVLGLIRELGELQPLKSGGDRYALLYISYTCIVPSGI